MIQEFEVRVDIPDLGISLTGVANLAVRQNRMQLRKLWIAKPLEI